MSSIGSLRMASAGWVAPKLAVSYILMVVAVRSSALATDIAPAKEPPSRPIPQPHFPRRGYLPNLLSSSFNCPVIHRPSSDPHSVSKPSTQAARQPLYGLGGLY